MTGHKCDYSVLRFANESKLISTGKKSGQYKTKLRFLNRAYYGSLYSCLKFVCETHRNLISKDNIEDFNKLLKVEKCLTKFMDHAKDEFVKAIRKLEDEK